MTCHQVTDLVCFAIFASSFWFQHGIQEKIRGLSKLLNEDSNFTIFKINLEKWLSVQDRIT